MEPNNKIAIFGSAIVCICLYNYIFKSAMIDLFHLNLLWRMSIMIFCWIILTGFTFGMLSKQSAFQKINQN